MDFQTLTSFELRQICYFMTVVKSGNNLTQAAHRLGIKQPPLTQSIQALEKLLSADPKAACKNNLSNFHTRTATK